MAEEKISQLRFKGSRTYAHGTDIFREIIEFANQHIGSYPEEVSGSFHGLLRKQGKLILFLAGEEVEVHQPVVQFSLIVGGQKYRAALTEADTEITARYAYDEDDVLSCSTISGKEISMTYRDDYTYIEQIVAMTKSLHHAVYSDVHEKWLFTKIKLKGHIAPSSYVGAEIAVVAVKNFHNKLSQCIVLGNGEQAGQIYFSILTQGANQ